MLSRSASHARTSLTGGCLRAAGVGRRGLLCIFALAGGRGCSTQHCTHPLLHVHVSVCLQRLIRYTPDLTQLTCRALALRRLQHHLRDLVALPFYMHGAAAVVWVLCAELFSMGSKAPASSAAMAVLFASGAAANLIFLTLHTWLHYAAFLVFAAIAGRRTT